jgi:uncharacterized integral membrane protein
MVSYVKSILFWLLLALFLAFAIDNRTSVQLSLFPLPYTASMPLFLLAILCLALGAVLGGLAVSSRAMRARRKEHDAQKRIAALENELAALKTERTAIGSHGS